MYLYLNTLELKTGDIIHEYGMRILLDTAPVTFSHGGEEGRVFRGTVLNVADLVASEVIPTLIPRSFLYEYSGRTVIRRDRWTIQGNHLATWTVERQVEPNDRRDR